MKNKKAYCTTSLLTALLLPSFASAAEDSIDSLLAMDIEELAEVSVASKSSERISEAPGIINVITAKEIKQYGDKTLGDVLNRVPSFHVLSSFVAQKNYASIRGQSLTHYDNHTLVLLNGRPVRDSGSGSMGNSIYRAFPVEAIERIEIIRGPGSALYGTNAFAGVVNIVTKTAADHPYSRADVTYGSNNHKQAFLSSGQKIDNASVYAAGKIASNEGWQHRFTDETGRAHSNDYDTGEYSGLATLDYKKFTLGAYASTGIENSIGIVPIGSDIDNKIHRNHLDAGYTFDINEDFYIDTNLTYNQSNWYPSPNPSVESRDYLAEATAHYAMQDNLKLVLGGTSEYRSGIVTSQEYTNRWYSAYAQVEYKPIEELKLVAGGQHNKVEGAEGSFVPRAGVIYNYNENWGAKLLYGEAFRGASALETDIAHPVIVGNPSLQPEEIATYDAQIFYNDASYNAAITYFNSKITNIISRTPLTPPTFGYTNAGEVKTEGVELEGNWKVTAEFSLQANATFQMNDDGNGARNATADSNTMIKAGAVYIPYEGLTLGIFDSYFDEAAAYPAANEVNPPAEAHHLLSATANIGLEPLLGNWFNSMEFALHGENLLDEDVYYPEFARQRVNTIPQASGRLLYGTFSLKF